MTNRMINNRISKLFELESHKRELESEISKLKEELQSEMDLKKVSSIDTGRFIIRLTDVSSDRLDTKRFKSENEALFAAYSVPVNYRRFSYSVH